MNLCIKALVAGALTLMMAGTASAHGKVRAYVEVRPYYPPMVQMHPHYAPVPVYQHYRPMYADPGWHARSEWRRNHWRDDHWRGDHWRGDQWRHDHWRAHHHRHHHRHHHHHWRR